MFFTRIALLPSPLLPLLLWAIYSAMLGMAYVLQYGFGYAPCEMCLWQRGPYWAVVTLGLIVIIAIRRQAVSHAFLRKILLLMLLAFLVNTGLGLLHFGVEQRWWEGPTGCSGSGAVAGSLDALKESIMAAPIVRCDEPELTILALSLSGWNMVASLALMLLTGYFLGLVERRAANARTQNG